MLIDLMLHIIQVRHDNIIYRLCKTAIYKDKREKIIKANNEIDAERQKIIDAAKALNPNVRIPGEKVEEENKEEENQEIQILENVEFNEEKKSNEIKEEIKEHHKEEKKEKKENKEIHTNTENKENEGEQNEEENKDEIDSAKLAEDLKQFDEENPKEEIPPDVEYDIDNDYDIEQKEKDAEINNALQAINNALVEKEKNKANAGQNVANNNGQPVNP